MNLLYYFFTLEFSTSKPSLDIAVSISSIDDLSSSNSNFTLLELNNSFTYMEFFTTSFKTGKTSLSNHRFRFNQLMFKGDG